jgi:ABC-type phosphate transport system substrate-binding protein
MRRRAIAFLFSAWLTTGAVEAADYVVVVNVANPTTSLGKTELARVFLKQTGKWEHGENVIPVDQDKRSPTRQAFTTAVLGRSVTAVLAYWNQKIFSGAEVPPIQGTSDEQVLEFVRANAGAVGYVSSSAGLRDVKVLRVVDKDR